MNPTKYNKCQLIETQQLKGKNGDLLIQLDTASNPQSTKSAVPSNK